MPQLPDRGIPAPADARDFHPGSVMRPSYLDSVSGLGERAFRIMASIEDRDAIARLRNPAGFQAHNERNAARIQRIAEIALDNVRARGAQSVLIIGTNPEEIPLKFLTENFDDVALVGLHTRPAAGVKDQLGSASRVTADPTGVMSEITNRIDAVNYKYLNEEGNDIDGFLSHLSNDLSNVPVLGRSPDLFSSHNIVISSGALSSLLRLPRRYIQDTLRIDYNGQRPSEGTIHSLKQTLQRLTWDMEVEHVDLLARSVDKEHGVCSVTDVIEEEILRPDGHIKRKDVVVQDHFVPLLLSDFRYLDANRNGAPHIPSVDAWEVKYADDFSYTVASDLLEPIPSQN